MSNKDTDFDEKTGALGVVKDPLCAGFQFQCDSKAWIVIKPGSITPGSPIEKKLKDKESWAHVEEKHIIRARKRLIHEKGMGDWGFFLFFQSNPGECVDVVQLLTPAQRIVFSNLTNPELAHPPMKWSAIIEAKNEMMFNGQKVPIVSKRVFDEHGKPRHKYPEVSFEDEDEEMEASSFPGSSSSSSSSSSGSHSNKRKDPPVTPSSSSSSSSSTIAAPVLPPLPKRAKVSHDTNELKQPAVASNQQPAVVPKQSNVTVQSKSVPQADLQKEQKTHQQSSSSSNSSSSSSSSSDDKVNEDQESDEDDIDEEDLHRWRCLEVLSSGNEMSDIEEDPEDAVESGEVVTGQRVTPERLSKQTFAPPPPPPSNSSSSSSSHCPPGAMKQSKFYRETVLPQLGLNPSANGQPSVPFSFSSPQWNATETEFVRVLREFWRKEQQFSEQTIAELKKGKLSASIELAAAKLRLVDMETNLSKRLTIAEKKVAELSNPDFTKMNMEQLKQEIKWSLLRMMSIQEESLKREFLHKQIEEGKCVVCLDRHADHVISCGHILCKPCADTISSKKCPTPGCGQSFDLITKVYSLAKQSPSKR